jgi:hypothetical protein
MYMVLLSLRTSQQLTSLHINPILIFLSAPAPSIVQSLHVSHFCLSLVSQIYSNISNVTHTHTHTHTHTPHHTTHTHTHTHTHSVGLLWIRVISPSQGPLLDNTQNSIHAPAGFEHTIPANERPHTHALDRAATGVGSIQMISNLIFTFITKRFFTIRFRIWSGRLGDNRP